MNNTIYEKMFIELEKIKDRSVWNKGVNLYAFEFVEALAERAKDEGQNPKDLKELEDWLLDGAKNWKQYSYNGNALIYDASIANRLCSASELKKTHYGNYDPNKNETWLDVQARALYQANLRVVKLYEDITQNKGE